MLDLDFIQPYSFLPEVDSLLNTSFPSPDMIQKAKTAIVWYNALPETQAHQADLIDLAAEAAMTRMATPDEMKMVSMANELKAIKEELSVIMTYIVSDPLKKVV